MDEHLSPNPPMPDSAWSAGSLRITSRTLTTSEVTAGLGLGPDDAFERGSLSSPRNPASRRLDASVWILRSGLGNSRWPDEHVTALVERLDGKGEALSLLAAECETELFLGFGSESGQGGCTLPARLLEQVARLGLDITLDLYPPTDGADD